MSRPWRSTAGDVVLGVVYLGIAGAVLLGSLAAYHRVLSDDITVTVRAGAVGNALRPGSDVKLLGVPVGTVTDIRPSTGGATLVLDIDREQARSIPRDSEARMLPESLFGERFVSLVSTGDGTDDHLRNGDVIAQDASDEARHMEHVFDSLLPVLNAVKPAKLNATLSEMAAALRDQGDHTGDAMEQWGQYVKRLNRHVPTLTRDLELLGEVGDVWADASPDLLAALDAMTTTTQTIVATRTELRSLFRTVTTSASSATGWLAANSDTVIELSATSRRVLETLARYSPEFPCLSRALTGLIPKLEQALGAGTDERGLHVQVEIVPAPGKYDGGDAPVLATGGKPTCPYGHGAAGAPARGRADASAPNPTVLRVHGEVNSPSENRMVTELLAARAESDPADLPGWSSLLVGPLVRNATVTLR